MNCFKRNQHIYNSTFLQQQNVFNINKKKLTTGFFIEKNKTSRLKCNAKIFVFRNWRSQVILNKKYLNFLRIQNQNKNYLNSFQHQNLLKASLCLSNRQRIILNASSSEQASKLIKSQLDSFSNKNILQNFKNNSSQNIFVPSGHINLAKPSLESFTYWNQCFDKNRLKNFVLWFISNYGEKKTLELVEELKSLGFQYATKAGISLGIDDLKIPPKKADLICEGEKITVLTTKQYKRGEITGVERFQRLIDTWHRTSENLKQEVISYFESTDALNPVFMMAFSGARGNISQVRQLVGMRGLMSNPQGQIIDYPIRSNFREGLTLTEYIISSYGARKGIVDTALRTANAGYLTRRLVDVAQHVIISNFDCKTNAGIFLTDMKEGNKIIYSLQNRLVGRVLAENIQIVDTKSSVKRSKESLYNSPLKTLKKNTEISLDLSFDISKKYKKVFVRSVLTCKNQKLICQLCYGWSLAQGNLVSIGEAVGIIAAQSIGEPGTQLTMRTFHTGGVFSGAVTDQIKAPFIGFIEYNDPIPGKLIRTPEGKIAFLTTNEGFFIIRPLQASLEKDEVKKYKVPIYTLLFKRMGEQVFSNEVIAQISSLSKQKNATDDAELTIKSELEGQLYGKGVLVKYSDIGPKLRKDETTNPIPFDPLFQAAYWGESWVLSGKIYRLSLPSFFFPIIGDFINRKTVINQMKWKFHNEGFFNSSSLNFYPCLTESTSLRSEDFNISSPKKFTFQNFKPLLPFRVNVNTNFAPSEHLKSLEKNPYFSKSYPYQKNTLNSTKQTELQNIPLIKYSLLSLNLKNIIYKKLSYFIEIPGGINPNFKTNLSTQLVNYKKKNTSFEKNRDFRKAKEDVFVLISPLKSFQNNQKLKNHLIKDSNGQQSRRLYSNSSKFYVSNPQSNFASQAFLNISKSPTNWIPNLKYFLAWYPSNLEIKTPGLISIENESPLLSKNLEIKTNIKTLLAFPSLESNQENVNSSKKKMAFFFTNKKMQNSFLPSQEPRFFIFSKKKFIDHISKLCPEGTYQVEHLSGKAKFESPKGTKKPNEVNKISEKFKAKTKPSDLEVSIFQDNLKFVNNFSFKLTPKGFIKFASIDKKSRYAKLNGLSRVINRYLNPFSNSISKTSSNLAKPSLTALEAKKNQTFRHLFIRSIRTNFIKKFETYFSNQKIGVKKEYFSEMSETKKNFPTNFFKIGQNSDIKNLSPDFNIYLSVKNETSEQHFRTFSKTLPRVNPKDSLHFGIRFNNSYNYFIEKKLLLNLAKPILYAPNGQRKKANKFMGSKNFQDKFKNLTPNFINNNESVLDFKPTLKNLKWTKIISKSQMSYFTKKNELDSKQSLNFYKDSNLRRIFVTPQVFYEIPLNYPFIFLSPSPICISGANYKKTESPFCYQINRQGFVKFFYFFSNNTSINNDHQKLIQSSSKFPPENGKFKPNSFKAYKLKHLALQKKINEITNLQFLFSKLMSENRKSNNLKNKNLTKTIFNKNLTNLKLKKNLFLIPGAKIKNKIIKIKFSSSSSYYLIPNEWLITVGANRLNNSIFELKNKEIIVSLIRLLYFYNTNCSNLSSFSKTIQYLWLLENQLPQYRDISSVKSKSQANLNTPTGPKNSLNKKTLIWPNWNPDKNSIFNFCVLSCIQNKNQEMWKMDLNLRKNQSFVQLYNIRSNKMSSSNQTSLEKLKNKIQMLKFYLGSVSLDNILSKFIKIELKKRKYFSNLEFANFIYPKATKMSKRSVDSLKMVFENLNKKIRNENSLFSSTGDNKNVAKSGLYGSKGERQMVMKRKILCSNKDIFKIYSVNSNFANSSLYFTKGQRITNQKLISIIDCLISNDITKRKNQLFNFAKSKPTLQILKNQNFSLERRTKLDIHMKFGWVYFCEVSDFNRGSYYSSPGQILFENIIFENHICFIEDFLSFAKPSLYVPSGQNPFKSTKSPFAKFIAPSLEGTNKQPKIFDYSYCYSNTTSQTKSLTSKLGKAKLSEKNLKEKPNLVLLSKQSSKWKWLINQKSRFVPSVLTSRKKSTSSLCPKGTTQLPLGAFLIQKVCEYQNPQLSEYKNQLYTSSDQLLTKSLVPYELLCPHVPSGRVSWNTLEGTYKLGKAKLNKNDIIGFKKIGLLNVLCRSQLPFRFEKKVEKISLTKEFVYKIELQKMLSIKKKKNRILSTKFIKWNLFCKKKYFFNKSLNSLNLRSNNRTIIDDLPNLAKPSLVGKTKLIRTERNIIESFTYQRNTKIFRKKNRQFISKFPSIDINIVSNLKQTFLKTDMLMNRKRQFLTSPMTYRKPKTYSLFLSYEIPQGLRDMFEKDLYLFNYQNLRFHLSSTKFNQNNNYLNSLLKTYIIKSIPREKIDFKRPILNRFIDSFSNRENLLVPSLIPIFFNSPYFSYNFIQKLYSRFMLDNQFLKILPSLNFKNEMTQPIDIRIISEKVEIHNQFLTSKNQTLSSSKQGYFLGVSSYYSPFQGEVIYQKDLHNLHKKALLSSAKPSLYVPSGQNSELKIQNTLFDRLQNNTIILTNEDFISFSFKPKKNKIFVPQEQRNGSLNVNTKKTGLIHDLNIQLQYDRIQKKQISNKKSITKTNRFSKYHIHNILKELETQSIKKVAYSLNEIIIKYEQMTLNFAKPSLTVSKRRSIKKVGKNHWTNGKYLINNLVVGLPIQKNHLSLGEFFKYGDIFKEKRSEKKDLTALESGQIIHLSKNKFTLRRGQLFKISMNAILHKHHRDIVIPQSPVITLSYSQLKTGDIVQGIPKIEQFFEARTTKRGRLFRDSLPNLLQALFKYNMSNLTNDDAARESIYKIQQILIDGVQRVYRGQGVTIADKHLEVIVRQMTSKARILKEGCTGYLAGDIDDLSFIERVYNQYPYEFEYEPLILGISKTSLEVKSFLSAASFQHTTRVLTKAAIYRETDYLSGLKENILLGNLIPAGTGYLVSVESNKPD